MKAATYMILAKAIAVLALSLLAAWNVEGRVNPVGDDLVAVMEDNDSSDGGSEQRIPAKSCVKGGQQVVGLDCVVCIPVCFFDLSGGVACGACLATCSVTPI